MTESLDARRARAARIVDRLRSLYPEASCSLDHRDALQLLVATILSAQCTDERVNRITPALFRRYPDAAAYACAEPSELEDAIRSAGFFRNKARAIVALGRALVERHGGRVPERLEDLTALPGVGRKTANVVLGSWFGREAITVDTHVARLSARLGLSSRRIPDAIETDLAETLPRDSWTFASHALIQHGRRVCGARRPQCDACSLRPDCPFPVPAKAPGRGARRS